MNAHCFLESPVGRLTLVASEQALHAVLWEKDDPARVPIDEGKWTPDHPILVATVRQLEAYFRRELRAFDLPLEPMGTPFQQQVWQQLLAIPYGQTRSYGQLAVALGDPKRARAVGAANGRNPISIIVPCHRVIGTSGKLTGFAGGLEAKQRLLALEVGQLSLAD